jgi:hypothetical protein
LCIKNDEILYDSHAGLLVTVGTLTTRLRLRFAYFFGNNGEYCTVHEAGAVQRLQEMDAALTLWKKNDGLDMKFGFQ